MKFPLFAPDGDGAGAGAGAAAAGADKGAAAGGAAAAGADAGKGGAAAGAAAAGADAGKAAGAGADAGKGGGDGAGAGGAGAGAAAPLWDADHWKSTFAGDDAKKKAWAERRPDIKTALETGFQADQKISELTAIAKTVLPKDATPEQITQYRKDNGIPEKPEGYLDALSPEVKAKLDDSSKGIITPYLGLIQKHNLSPTVAAEFIEMRQAEATRLQDARIAEDAVVRQKTEDTLRQDWGNNYRAEINNVNNLLSGAPDEVRNMLFNARTPDGTGLMAGPEALRWFAQLARTVNPYSVPVGNDGGLLDQKGVEARIAEIDGWMGAAKGSENYKRYYENANVQAEYRQLVDAKAMLTKRTAA